MPQMSPMNWIMLFFYFFMVYFLILVMINFFFLEILLDMESLESNDKEQFVKINDLFKIIF